MPTSSSVVLFCCFVETKSILYWPGWSGQLFTSLTHNGKDDHHKVKDVPANSEEIAAKGYELDDALSSEDDNKGKVDVVQDQLHAGGLFICFHHHGHHVEEDEQHYHDVESLFWDQVKEESLHWVLDGRNFFINIVFLCKGLSTQLHEIMDMVNDQI